MVLAIALTFHIEASFSQSVFDNDTVKFCEVTTQLKRGTFKLLSPGCYERIDYENRLKSDIVCDTLQDVRLIFWSGKNVYLFDNWFKYYKNWCSGDVDCYRLNNTIQIGNYGYHNYAPFKPYVKGSKIIYEVVETNADYNIPKAEKSHVQGVLNKDKAFKLSDKVKPFFCDVWDDNTAKDNRVTYTKDTLINYKDKKIDCYLFYFTKTVDEALRYNYYVSVEKTSLLPVFTKEVEICVDCNVAIDGVMEKVIKESIIFIK